MKIIKYISRKGVDLWKKCFSLLSAFTLFLTIMLILTDITGMLDINGMKKDFILWGYIAFVAIYTMTKIEKRKINIFGKMMALWSRLIHKEKTSDDPVATPKENTKTK